MTCKAGVSCGINRYDIILVVFWHEIWWRGYVVVVTMMLISS